MSTAIRVFGAVLLAAAPGYSLDHATAAGRAPAPSCPAPTIARGTHCALDRDQTLGATLVLSPGTMLDCAGHSLRPAALSEIDAQGAVRRSQPDTAIGAFDARGVAVHACDIEGFTFGVVLADGKAQPGGAANEISGNTIVATMGGVILARVDDSVVADNVITAGCTGVTVMLDSSRNSVRSNLLRDGPVRAVSGPILPGAPTTPDLLFHSGVAVAYFRDIPLQRLTLGGESRLFAASFARDATGAPVENVRDTLVSGNSVELPAPPISDIVSVAFDVHESEGTVVRGNTVDSPDPSSSIAADWGVLVTGLNASFYPPGTCSGSGAPCSLANACVSSPAACAYDIPCDDGSSCVMPAPVPWNSPSRGARVENNQLSGPFALAGVRVALAEAPQVTANTVSGANTTRIGDQRVSGAGLHLLANALEGATVTGNLLQGNVFGLYVDQRSATGFGSVIALNDLSGNSLAPMGTAKGYAYPTSLSDGTAGNYWGHTCDEGGFLASDAIVRDTGLANLMVTDPHPLGASPIGQDAPLICR
jgi:hypothetical protein